LCIQNHLRIINPRNQMVYLVIKQPWGGLGDNLQFSLIPEILKLLGTNINCVISKDNVYRNQEIYQLCWGINPNVQIPENDGLIDSAIYLSLDYQNFGYSMTKNWAIIAAKRLGFSNIVIQSALNQLSDKPVIHYKPKRLIEYQEQLIIDFKSTTDPLVNTTKLIEVFQQKYQKKAIIIGDSFPHLMLKSIFHYCDIIHSAKHFVCAFSGQSVLAAAIRQSFDCITVRSINQIKNDSYYCWNNGNYLNNQEILKD